MTIHDHRIFHPGGLWLDFTSLERVTLDDGETVWRHRVRNGWRKTYGARLTENVIQWLARLVISEAMVRIHHRIGVRMPLTVHDDVFFLIPKTGMNGVSAEHILEMCGEEMSRPLTWLPECPISVDSELLDALSK
jgi:hypothetical protein